MSGGRFNYAQRSISDIVDAIEQEIQDNDSVLHRGEYYKPYEEDTIDEFKKGVELLKKAQIYTQRIDWLLSGDDGEETFHERLAEDLLTSFPPEITSKQ